MYHSENPKIWESNILIIFGESPRDAEFFESDTPLVFVHLFLLPKCREERACNRTHLKVKEEYLQDWKSGWKRWREVTRDWHDLLLRHVSVHKVVVRSIVHGYFQGLFRVSLYKEVGTPTNDFSTLLSTHSVWLRIWRNPISPIYLLWESSCKLFIYCERHPQ